ncbi:TIGR01777 family oxidoreductase [Saccharicrinis sp. FJH2]|uniref:TIGR01777 family oxidoreductase n=1 Tax=Saccharicrinis sp. FJH65 TaxID=3344659 RepID=UPI0035F32020
MKIAIAGITGYIGQKLSEYLMSKGHEIVPVKRNHFKLSQDDFAAYLKGCDAVINLSGAPVIKRWTESWKKEILSSRVETTRKIVGALTVMKRKPEVYINASAIGIYDYEHENDETTPYFGHNFLADVVKQWEAEAKKVNDLEIRSCITRFGVVLGKDGSAFPVMKKPFEWFVGGKIGNGQQAMSFIHIEDLIRALEELLLNKKASGVYNLVAPEYCTNKEFTQTLAKALHRPALFTVPVFALKLLYGGAAEVVVGGEKVRPVKLRQQGFKFNYPDIKSTIDSLV